MKKFDREQLMYLFTRINDKLKQKNKFGELLICGGALMSIVYNRKELTQDIDALFKPKDIILEIINEISIEENLPKDWLNDDVKKYLQLVNLGTEIVFDLSNLKVKGVSLPVMLGMKLMAFRNNKDNSDIFSLIIRYGVFDWDLIIDKISNYVPRERLLVSKMLLQSMFKDYKKEELVKKHYELIYDNKHIINCLTDLVVSYNYDNCPSAEEFLREEVKDSEMEGKIIYLNELLK